MIAQSWEKRTKRVRDEQQIAAVSAAERKSGRSAALFG
jgi:hypothetical protein